MTLYKWETVRKGVSVKYYRINSFSSRNTYANNYYDAYKQFTKARNKVIKYENQTNDKKSPIFKALMSEYDYWNNKLPKLSNIAEKEEKKLKILQAKKDTNGNTQSPFYINNQLNYLA